MLPDRAAFFDIDDTLIATKSMFDFQGYYFAHSTEHRGSDPQALMAEFRKGLADAVPDGDRAALNRTFYRSFAGRARSETAALADVWFKGLERDLGDSLWIETGVSLLSDYRKQGFAIVGVSGSSHEILAPIARRLGFDHLLAARLEVSGGVFTGKLLAPQTIGAGKATAIRALVDQAGFDLPLCAACGDHISDLAMLELAGKAHVIAGDPELEALARSRGWPVLPRGMLTSEPALHV